MWHELGHDVLNAAHIQGERAIMNTPLPDEYDLDIFKREEAELFNGKDLTFLIVTTHISIKIRYFFNKNLYS